MNPPVIEKRTMMAMFSAEGGYNFTMFDSKTQQFFKFNRVFAEDKDGNLIKLPCYQKPNKLQINPSLKR